MGIPHFTVPPGDSLADFLHAVSSDQSLLAAHHRALQGQAFRFDFTSGDREWLGRAEPIFGPQKEITGVSAALFENTDRVFAEKSLRLSEQSYRSLIEEAPFAICRVTLSGQLLHVNRAMVETLGYESEQELLIRSLKFEIFAKPLSYDEFVSNLRSSGPLQGFESTWLCQDGKSISVSLAGRATRDPSGQISFLDILAENITERKQLEHQLRQSQKMQAVGQLAGGIAHDFNNLLTVINGQVELALSEVPVGDPMRQRLEDVEEAATRAARLTRQLLAFGRIHTIEAKVLNLNAIVSGMTQMLAPLIGKGVSLEFVPGKNLGHIKADAAQFEQVVMNLVLNAKDATPEGGTLSISTEDVRLDGTAPVGAFSRTDISVAPAGEYVALTVIDNGHGMSLETQARIFEPFFTTKKPGHGTGLGLATVYNIVKQNKGYITAQSELGRGSRFTIYMPRVDTPAKKAQPSSPLPLHGGKEVVLIAEDEAGIRKFAASFLTGLGYSVLTAADGIEAMEMAHEREGKIDLLLTDMIMPRLGGRDLAEELHRAFPHLKIIFMSGYPGDAGILGTLKALNAQLLLKPFPSMPALAKIVRDTLDRV
jgi:two-component system, cell cycle sensor histidine kinase and response regulator CckA